MSLSFSPLWQSILKIAKYSYCIGILRFLYFSLYSVDIILPETFMYRILGVVFAKYAPFLASAGG